MYIGNIYVSCRLTCKLSLIFPLLEINSRKLINDSSLFLRGQFDIFDYNKSKSKNGRYKLIYFFEDPSCVCLFFSFRLNVVENIEFPYYQVSITICIFLGARCDY